MLFGLQKINKYLFKNPIVEECNNILHSCKTKDDRIRVATLIRPKVKLDLVTDILLSQGQIGALRSSYI